MLRTIKSPNRRARLVAFSGTTSAGAVNTVQVGAQEGTFANATDPNLILTLKKPFVRTPVAIATAGADIANGGLAFSFPAETVTAIGGYSVSGAGSDDVGGVEVLALGYDVADAVNYNESLSSPVSSSFPSPVIVAGQVDSDGTKLIGGSTFTSVKNSTGNYTITFTRAFGRLPTVVASAFVAGFTCQVKSKTNNSVTIQTCNVADSLADAKFNFIAYGSSQPHEVHMSQGGAVSVGFRKPRILGANIVYTTGVPAVVKGAGLITVADTDTGTATITFTRPFARPPIIVTSPISGNVRWSTFLTAGYSSTGAVIEFGTMTSATPADPPDAGGCNMIIIGSDDATEY